MSLLWLSLATTAGVGLTLLLVLILRLRGAGDWARLEARANTAEQQAVEIEQLRERLEMSQQRSAAAEQQNRDLQAAQLHERERLAELQREVETRFTQLAQKAIRETQSGLWSQAREELSKERSSHSELVQQRQQAVENLVKPLQERLLAISREQAEFKGILTQQLVDLKSYSTQVAQQAQQLSDALRHAPKARGRWGEMQLRNVLELAGLSAHVDYQLEVSTRDEEGALKRPDALIRLPGGRRLVVDAKAPLSGFWDASEARDEAAQTAGLARHAQAVRDHARDLAKKAYWEQFDEAPDFVILFLPGENFYIAAVSQNPDLFDEALASGVLIVGPTMLLALAKGVAQGWRQEALVDNAKAIGQLGKELYDALKLMGDRYLELGQRLESANRSYGKMVGSLERTVMPKARKFTTLQNLDALPQLDRPDRAVRQLSGVDFRHLTRESSED